MYRGDIMKKSCIGFIFGVILTLSITSAADTYYQFAKSENTLYVDGTKIEMPLYNYQYTNYASIRAVAEALGLDIKVTDKRIDFISPLTDLETVVKNCKDSCVMIYAYNGNKVSQGSGWIYNGYIVTANHVVEGAERIDIFFDDEKYSRSASIVPIETDLDVAVLKTYIAYPSVALGNSDNLKEGEKLVAITSPKGTQNTVDECVNSGMAYVEDGDFLTISESNINNGSSGGAIFNYQSELIGMVIKTHYTIPINDIKPILENLK